MSTAISHLKHYYYILFPLISVVLVLLDHLCLVVLHI